MGLFHDSLDIVYRTYSHIQTMYKLIILMLFLYLHWLRAVLVLAGGEARVCRSIHRGRTLIRLHPCGRLFIMLDIDKQHTMNPSVEEVKDEASAGASNGATSAENGQLSWSKVSIWLQGRPRGSGVTVNGCTEKY